MRFRGFTLIETLVAIGVLALVGVGLAAIFQTVSDTVGAGRRVSRFTQAAALIERQMSQDFARMSRDGVLVIRHQFMQANPDATIEPDPSAGETVFDGIATNPEDGNPRLRRSDEIAFFARGRFESARQALHPDLPVEAVEARVYYGHGRRGPRSDGSEQARSIERAPFYYMADTTLTPASIRPNDSVSRGLGVRPLSGSVENPNEFASEWTLLRHVTLIVPEPEGPGNVAEAMDELLGVDEPPLDLQADPFNGPFLYQGQPAAPTIFREPAALSQLPSPPGSGDYVRTEREVFAPRFDSGLVDIAFGNIATTNLVIQRSEFFPFLPVPSGASQLPFGIDPSQPEFLLDSFPRVAVSAGAYDSLNYYPLLQTGGAGELTLQRMHAWMEQILPARSLVFDAGRGTAQGDRIRAEIGPTDFRGVLTEPSIVAGAGDARAQSLAREIARSDQFALSMSNFAVSCTEFIVEWSFGEVYGEEAYRQGNRHTRRGELVWYGGTSIDPDRRLPVSIARYPDGDRFSARPPNASLRAHQPFPAATSDDVRFHRVSPDLIYQGRAPGINTPSLQPLTAMFGAIDPTYPQDGSLDDNSPGSVPWAWPRLIRVTITLADPLDPAIEETFQFVFEVPESGAF